MKEEIKTMKVKNRGVGGKKNREVENEEGYQEEEEFLL